MCKKCMKKVKKSFSTSFPKNKLPKAGQNTQQTWFAAVACKNQRK